jgi:isopenicillin N synthase-like dioxygenase
VDIKRVQNEIDLLKGQIIEAWPTGTYKASDLKVQVKPGTQRLDVKRFMQAYPATSNPTLYKVTPDAQAARRTLGELALEPLMKHDKGTTAIAVSAQPVEKPTPYIAADGGDVVAAD